MACCRAPGICRPRGCHCCSTSTVKTRRVPWYLSTRANTDPGPGEGDSGGCPRYIDEDVRLSSQRETAHSISPGVPSRHRIGCQWGKCAGLVRLRGRGAEIITGRAKGQATRQRRWQPNESASPCSWLLYSVSVYSGHSEECACVRARGTGMVEGSHEHGLLRSRVSQYSDRRYQIRMESLGFLRCIIHRAKYKACTYKVKPVACCSNASRSPMEQTNTAERWTNSSHDHQPHRKRRGARAAIT